MQRDWECIRAIMLALDSKPSAATAFKPEMLRGEFDIEVVQYNLDLLLQHNLATGKSLWEGGRPVFCIAYALTWEGHELLDKLRCDNVWAKICALIRERGAEVGFDTIKAAAVAVVEQMLRGGR